MKKTLKRLCTGFLALATVVTALPTTTVHAESKQYWTESAERVGIIEKVMNDGSIGSTFNEGMMKVEGETAYCIDINTDFKNGYKTRADASSRMSADQISDVALSLEYVKQYGEAHKELNYKQVYLFSLYFRCFHHLRYLQPPCPASIKITFFSTLPEAGSTFFTPLVKSRIVHASTRIPIHTSAGIFFSRRSYIKTVTHFWTLVTVYSERNPFKNRLNANHNYLALLGRHFFSGVLLEVGVFSD